jgi:hypothetical protein
MSTEQINALVAEYNAVEAEQSGRLLQLFRLLEARKGFRSVSFAGRGMSKWSNCWGREERLAVPEFITPMNQAITEIVLGE